MNNIKTNMTLEQYNKKYHKRRNKLHKVSKEEVALNKNVLNNRKWCLIENTYYEIPKTFSMTWFVNLGVAAQIATCGVLCVGVSSAVVFPTLANTVWKKNTPPAPTPEPTRDPDWITKENWYDLTSNATKEDIGKEVKVKVNGLEHNVALIDVDNDTDESGNKIHTTWQFSNMISDEDGYSLAYQWRDSRHLGKSSEPEYSKWTGKTLSYYDSSINYALNGHGTNGFKNVEKSDDPESDYQKYYKDYVENKENEILVTRGPKDTETQFITWTKEDKYCRPIINMLPEELTNKMKGVSKVNNEKLFLLSSREIDGGYAYYRYSGIKNRVRRIKKQVFQKTESGEQYIKNRWYAINNDQGQLYNTNKISAHAGRNEKIAISGNELYGGAYWCRDLGILGDDGFQYINRISPKGVVGPGDPMSDAYGVAPAFCI